MLTEAVLDITIKALEAQPQSTESLKALGLMRALKSGDAIASLWWVDDVYSLTDDGEGNHNPKITNDEARAVLKAAEENHNAEIGINWDSLRDNLDMVLEGRDEN